MNQLRPRRRWIQWRNYRRLLHAPLSQEVGSRPLFILSEGRSGSSMLNSYLNSHPDISMAGEVLHKLHAHNLCRRTMGDDRQIEHIRRFIQHGQTQYSGFKIQLCQIAFRGWTVDEFFEFFPGSLVVVLYRQDLLRQYISTVAALQTNRFHRLDRKASSEVPKLHFDTEQYTKFCRRKRELWEAASHAQHLKEHAVAVSYETLVEAPQRWFESTLFPFIDVPGVPLASEFRKVLDKPVEEYVDDPQQVSGLLNDPGRLLAFQL